MDHHQTDYPDSDKINLEQQFPSEVAEKAAQQYQGTFKAKAYALRVPGTGTDRREKRCIVKALKR